MNALNTVLIAGIITYLIKQHQDQKKRNARFTQIIKDSRANTTVEEDGTITFTHGSTSDAGTSEAFREGLGKLKILQKKFFESQNTINRKA